MATPDLCMHPSGCDRPATVHVERPGHWHDDAFCEEHAIDRAPLRRAVETWRALANGDPDTRLTMWESVEERCKRLLSGELAPMCATDTAALDAGRDVLAAAERNNR